MLKKFLTEKIGDLITFLHLLPFYPYSSDDGFAVEDFRSVRPDLGTWDDVADLGQHYRLVFDAAINHVSASSGYMRSFSSGDARYADFFIEGAPDEDVSGVFRTRNLPLFHQFTVAGKPVWLWTTFGPDQVDLNYANPQVLLEILDVLLLYIRRGASVLRLDAVPYLWKERGTSCVHLPQTHLLIRLIRDILDSVAPHVLLLAEANAPHADNVRYVGRCGEEAQMIYNFCLPPLILWSLALGHAGKLTQWAAQLRWMGPRATYLNITATHDGIGMRPTEGLLDPAGRRMLIALARARGGDVSGRVGSEGEFLPYELNVNYYDALNDPASAESLEMQIDRFMLSQAIPMCLLGIPGIYIHSLLGSRNDLEAVKRTRRARAINRSQLILDRVLTELADTNNLRRKIFDRYCQLLRLRREQSAFHPDAGQNVFDLGPEFFTVRRINGETGEIIVAIHNVTRRLTAADATPCCDGEEWTDVLTGEQLSRPILEELPMQPYQVRWLKKTAPRAVKISLE
ncbi:MAG: alpha-amylase family glycosyl hydrolase [Kiritimatiellia bacterium]